MGWTTGLDHEHAMRLSTRKKKKAEAVASAFLVRRTRGAP